MSTTSVVPINRFPRSNRSFCDLCGLCVQQAVRDLAPRTSAALGETLDQIYGSETSQRSRPSTENSLSCHSKVGRRCEAEDLRDISDIQSRIFRELSRRYHPHEIYHSLEIRGAGSRKVTTQMLSADANFCCQRRGANGTAGRE